MILVPVKDLKNAKQRLASVLPEEARTELARAMLEDVLDAIAACDHRPRVTLVTRDPFALMLASRFGIEVIADHANTSETDAIATATCICESRGVPNTLVIPADIPLITAEEVRRIYDAAPPQGSVLVPAADGRGTNAVFRSPAGLFPLQFGNDSFQPHLAAARATEEPCTILELPGFGLDVDNPADLRQLIDAPGDTRAQRLARSWNLRDSLIIAGT
jgi:2-phospho-L-lactate guanylyltransferase